jgi:hypothetical protein
MHPRFVNWEKNPKNKNKNGGEARTRELAPAAQCRRTYWHKGPFF